MILQLQKVFFVYAEQHLFTFVLHIDQPINLIGSTQGKSEFFVFYGNMSNSARDNFDIGIYIYLGKLKALLCKNVLNDVSCQLRKRH